MNGAKRTWAPLLLLAFGSFPPTQAADPCVKFASLPADEPGRGAVPWVALEDFSWQHGPPLFSLANEEGDPAATGWMAASWEALRLHIVVADARHLNEQSGSSIWNGDALQIGLDMAGAGSGPLDAETELTREHSAALAFALTTNGPVAYAYVHGTPGADGPQPRLTPTIHRDDSKGTTTYDMVLPWSEFQAAPGIWPRVGLAVQVNDSDPGVPQKRIHWGRGGNGPLQPGLFNQVELAWPTSPGISVKATRTALWSPGECAEFQIAVAYPGEHSLAAQIVAGGVTNTFPLEFPAGAASALARYKVSLMPEDCDEHQAVWASVHVVDALHGTVLAGEEALLTHPAGGMAMLQEQLAKATLNAEHPLLARHFASIRALLATGWASALSVAGPVPERAAETARIGERIAARLDEDPSVQQWTSYIAGRRRLIFSYLSRGDQTLQFYLLGLPKDWREEQTYPLVVSLHGSGTAHPLLLAAGSFAPLSANLPTNDALDHVYYLTPWSRGNYGYHDLAEEDVLQAVENLQQSVRVDQERVYLTGFSLGGGGAWSLAVRHPDRWAAAAICSGGPWWTPVGQGYGINLSHLPTLFWHGEADTTVQVEETYAMRDELLRYTNAPEVRIITGRGHDFRAEDAQSIFRWLLDQGARRTPDKFSFAALDRDARSCRGIRLNWTPRSGLHPRVEVQVTERLVTLTTEETDGMELNLGEGGLGLKGAVTVEWNGKLVYNGPVGIIQLGARDPGDA